ncbi:hypothetical protein LWI29_015263 [Acer saccharum]|uniref:Alcohol dehydrogenase-like C-terminal domain-containing protein n=1 Tax=Acer saccharum TaxID=4024 RepID=A0AA39VFY3_ACESA|nr:hypothetical protein LWI29_015263 [Acer saccharum]
MMSPCKLLLVLISFVLLQTICEAGLLPAKRTVNISNYVFADKSEVDLTIHCKSGDDDLSEHILPFKGSEEKLAFCQKLGADVCINYKTEDFVARVKEETGGKAAGLRSRNLENKAEIISEVEKYVWPAITAGEVKPVIHKYFPLSEAAEAHQFMQSSQHIGKIMLVP